MNKKSKFKDEGEALEKLAEATAYHADIIDIFLFQDVFEFDHF